MIAGKGQRMEGVLAYPVGTAPSSSLLLLAPHPHMGGNMDNNVIKTIAQRAAEDGCVTLRFNYRGVGGSLIDLPQGVSTYDHYAEMEARQQYQQLLPDATDALTFLRAATKGIQKRTVLGYSLGAILAGMMDPQLGATNLLCISPPNARVSLELFNHCTLPKVFVGGDRDFAFDLDAFRHAFEGFPPPKTFVPLDGLDHFFRGQEDKVYDTLRPYLS